MNIADHVRRQFTYDEWANREVLSAIQAGGADERGLKLMSHILAAEQVWLDRLKQETQSIAVWPNPDLVQCETLAAELGKKWAGYLELKTAGDLAQSITYKNSKGEEWTSTVIDILTHVVMHSAYHRGQIASHMRATGRTPAYTDYIHGLRQGLVK